MTAEIKYKLADYDGGLDTHPIRESAGQLWLVGSWWELHFKHAEEFVNGELADYVPEALPVDHHSCLVSIRGLDTDGEILCTFLLPATSADRFMSDLDRSLGQLEAGGAEKTADPRDRPADRDWPEPTDFPVRMKAMVGQQLQLGSRAGFYELCSGDGQRVARFDLSGVSSDLVRLVCAEGEWHVNKRRKYGWELVIESADGRPVGSYSARRWGSGGTISVADVVRADLRHAPVATWKLRVSETRESIASLRGRKLALHSLPAELSYQAEVAVLTACAVALLTASIRVPFPGGAAG